MAESWFYLPFIGIAILTVRLLTGYVRLGDFRLKTAILITFMFYLSIITVIENRHWKNNRILFNHALRYAATSPVLYRNLSWVYINKGDIGSAIKSYSRALELGQTDKTRAILYKELAYAYLLNNDAQRAGELALESLKFNPDYAGSRGLLGLLYSEKDPARAVEECKRALDLDLFEPLAFNNLLQQSRSDRGMTNYLIGKYTKALGQVRGFPSYRVYRSLGVVYLYADMDSMAMTNLLKSLRLNPYDIKTNNALAICYVKRGDTISAEKFFKKSLRLNPFDREVYGNLAFFYSELGRDEEASLMRKKAYSVNLFE